jgi:hypothetical protein
MKAHQNNEKTQTTPPPPPKSKTHLLKPKKLRPLSITNPPSFKNEIARKRWRASSILAKCHSSHTIGQPTRLCKARSDHKPIARLTSSQGNHTHPSPVIRASRAPGNLYERNVSLIRLLDNIDILAKGVIKQGKIVRC